MDGGFSASQPEAGFENIQQRFSNLASDWLAALLPANHKPVMKILVKQHGFYNAGIFLVVQAHGYGWFEESYE